MTDERTEGDVRDAPIKWKVPTAGMVWEGSFVVLVDRDPHPFPCTAYGGPAEEIEAHLSTCRETWATVWALGGRHLGGGETSPGRVPLSRCRLPRE